MDRKDHTEVRSQGTQSPGCSMVWPARSIASKDRPLLGKSVGPDLVPKHPLFVLPKVSTPGAELLADKAMLAGRLKGKCWCFIRTKTTSSTTAELYFSFGRTQKAGGEPWRGERERELATNKRRSPRGPFPLEGISLHYRSGEDGGLAMQDLLLLLHQPACLGAQKCSGLVILKSFSNFKKNSLL